MGKHQQNELYLIQRQKQKNNKNISIIFDKTQLVQKQSIKFLEVVVDEHLSWKSHISYIYKKVSKSTGIIFRCRYYLSNKTKLSLYYSLVYPYLTYCNIVWSSNYKTNLKRIYSLQKRIVRALTNSDFRAHTSPLFTQLKILDIYKINLLPPSFHNLFITSHQVHSYSTRSSNSYRSHLCKTNSKFTILFQGPKIWNSLPNDILKTETLSYFRSIMFNFLLQS